MRRSPGQQPCIDSAADAALQLARSILEEPMVPDVGAIDWGLLEFSAAISSSGEEQLQRLARVGLVDPCEREHLEFLAAISTEHERPFQELLRQEAAAARLRERARQCLENIARCREADSWDPAKHPRLGGPPNAGWFAATGGSLTGASTHAATPTGSADALAYGTKFTTGLVKGFFVDGLWGDAKGLWGTAKSVANGLSFFGRATVDYFAGTNFVSDDEAIDLNRRMTALEEFGKALKAGGSDIVQALVDGDTEKLRQYSAFAAELGEAAKAALGELAATLAEQVKDPEMQGRIVGWVLAQVAAAVATAGLANAAKAGKLGELAAKLDDVAFLRENPKLLAAVKRALERANAVLAKAPGAAGKAPGNLSRTGPIPPTLGAMSRAEHLARKLKLNLNSPTTRQVLNSLDDTVSKFVSEFRQGKILKELPREVLNMTVEEALQHSAKARKLLIDGRFAK